MLGVYGDVTRGTWVLGTSVLSSHFCKSETVLFIEVQLMYNVVLVYGVYIYPF